MINSDERIEENLFLNNDVLDDDSFENWDVSSMNQSVIKSTVASKWWRNQWKYSDFEYQTKGNFWLCFDMGKRKNETEKLNQIQGSETI